MRTYAPKPGDVERAWLVIDATDVVLGRLAVTAANLLRGKHKPIFAPNADTGDYVIVVNADKVALSGNKRADKLVYRHSGFPGGLTATPIGEVLDKDARKAVESFITTVEKTLKKGDEVALTGFGKFSVAKRSARTGRNPQTGETVKIKASKAPKFTAGAGLKTAVNGARKK